MILRTYQFRETGIVLLSPDYILTGSVIDMGLVLVIFTF